MKPRFLLLQLITPHYHQDVAIRNMAELVQLVETYGGEVIEKTIQHRIKPHPAMYVGTGKVEALKEIVTTKKIDVIVLNHIVNSGQLFRLEKELWQVNQFIKVWDRVDLILNIFDQHASTTEAKLQIKLARVQHIGPRIYGLGGSELSRQGGGGGGGGGARRGAGETNVEIERRNIKKEKQKIEQQLKQIQKTQGKRIEQRKKKGISTVALVGYTSAGKTTLFNALTSKQKQTNQSLFTTLDSTVGKVKLSEYAPTILVSDTIGFIDDLPPFLINAFRSTLMESLEAQLIFHVVDASDSKMAEKIQIVKNILADLQVEQKPILIFNKIDQVDTEKLKQLKETYKEQLVYFVSAKTGENIQEIKNHINKLFIENKKQYIT